MQVRGLQLRLERLLLNIVRGFVLPRSSDLLHPG